MKLRNVLTVLLIFTTVFAVGCNKDNPDKPREFSDTREISGKDATIKMYGLQKQEQTIIASINMSLDEMQRLGYMLDISRATSRLSLINSHAVETAFELDDEMFTLFQNALTFAEMSDGAFDLTIAPLNDLWGIVG